jgi:SAM-dependent methyltransferase
MVPESSTQYQTDSNLRARQRLWAISQREPPFALYPWVLEMAGLRGGERILEVGCGNGEYLALVNAIGMDISMGMLAAAKRRARGPLVCGDVERLPFGQSAFDVVLAPHMLYHVANRQAAVHELRRVLRRSGTCVAVTNGEDNHREMVELVEKVVGHGWRWRRLAVSGFSLENGAAQLRVGFESVERVDCPANAFLVTDVDALAAYLASVGDLYESEVATWMTWGDVVDECRRRTALVVASDGAFRISTSIGAFVCR